MKRAILPYKPKTEIESYFSSVPGSAVHILYETPQHIQKSRESISHTMRNALDKSLNRPIVRRIYSLAEAIQVLVTEKLPRLFVG
jgi:hypothetical protein